MPIKFVEFTPEQQALVNTIVTRGVAALGAVGFAVEAEDLEMCVNAVHATCPLDLKRLAEAPRLDFGHDIGGIYHLLDRTTGRLPEHFLPRTALPHVAGEVT